MKHTVLNSKRITKNAIWIIASRVIQAILTFIIGMLTARYLGPSNYGVIGYASSLVAFVSPIMYLGIWNILVQELIENEKDEGKILGTSLTLNIIAAPLCVIGIVAFTMIANKGETETIIVCALYSTLLIFQAFEVIQYWFQAHLLSKYSSIVTLSAYIAISIYKTFLLVSGKSVYWFAVSNALDYLFIALGLYWIYLRKSKQKLSFSKDIAKRLLSRGKHYILSGMMVTFFSQTDRIMLKNMLSSEAIGYYNAAITAIIDSFRPLIFESKKNSLELFNQNMIKLYSLIIYISLLQCVFVTMFSKELIRYLYGIQYLPAINTLRIVVWFSTFSYVGTVRDIWILAKEKQHYLWLINLSGALCNVVINYLLIPIWGINGAAAASLITQMFTNVLIGFWIKDIRPNNVLIIRALNPRICINALKNIKLR